MSHPLFILRNMATKTPTPNTIEATLQQGQLVLVVDRPGHSWKIDDETKEIGRRGIAQARAALRARPTLVAIDEPMLADAA